MYLFVLKRLKHTSDKATKIKAYYDTFKSHMRYGLAVWGGMSPGNTLKKTKRILDSLPFRDDCREAFVSLKL